MPARPFRLRLLAFVVALVQLVGPAAASLADAQVEAAALSPQAASHIESHRRPECAHVHSDDCALCQYLSAGANHPETPAPPAPALAVGVPAFDRVLGAASTTLDALPRTRAPPTLGMPEA
jgi:hypothetical protein